MNEMNLNVETGEPRVVEDLEKETFARRGAELNDKWWTFFFFFSSWKKKTAVITWWSRVYLLVGEKKERKPTPRFFLYISKNIQLYDCHFHRFQLKQKT